MIPLLTGLGKKRKRKKEFGELIFNAHGGNEIGADPLSY